MYVGKPSPPEEIVDRTEEVDGIVERCSNEKVNYAIALLGYRRIGKTTILLKAKERLESRGVLVVYFDVKKNLSDPANFLKRLQKIAFGEYFRQMGFRKRPVGALKNIGEQAFHAISDAIKGIKGVGVQLTFKPNGDIELEPKMEFGSSPDYGEMFDATFESINRISKRIDVKLVVILDEFQDMIKLHRYRGLGNILDRFRDVIQNRAKNLSYVVSGSQIHITREFLEKGKGAAFLHFVEIDIEDLKEPSATELFEKYSGARRIGSSQMKAGAREAYRLVGGHPFYLMSLAEAWDGTKQLGEVYRGLLTSPRKPLSIYAEYVLAADLAEAKRGEPALRAILVSLAEGPKSVGEIAKNIGLMQAGLPSYLSELIKYDLVTFYEGKYAIRDKIIRDYLSFSR
ncbi:MAG: ATP-binding protein [archaeon]|nr:ATP-binding protein [archaeon]